MWSESEREAVVARNARSEYGSSQPSQPIASTKDPIPGSKCTLPVRTKGFDKPLGVSEAWLRAMKSAIQAAPSEINVLLHGETGTGKELLARSIHQRSARSDKPLVRIDCASLTPSLCESELYGHVRGAFTGAAARRAGLFELAEGGTLLIDEIGELPLQLQPRLLRLLQEREFETVGSSRVRRADVRVIAATNRDLRAEVAAGRFRGDLYYRLAAFSICLPPLRERIGDIELLAMHFLRVESARLRKSIVGLSPTALARLHSHTWPGNVRELRHAIERACIISAGSILRAEEFDLLQMEFAVQSADDSTASEACHLSTARSSLREVERQHISTVLRACGGIIEGKGGAAHVLGLPPSTLRYRMRKLGITAARNRVGPATSRSAPGVTCLPAVPECGAGM